MDSFGISKDIIEIIKVLYVIPESEVLLEHNIVDPLKTAIGVRIGFPLSPVLFNIFLETMNDVIKQCDRSLFQCDISIGVEKYPIFDSLMTLT